MVRAHQRIGRLQREEQRAGQRDYELDEEEGGDLHAGRLSAVGRKR
ncbi:MAG TPA: hypothetical protein VFP68_14470 [Burkholderiaceae bacterium]|nr:hypothetical protein [Burkholderiaceae bacterium]